MRTIVLMLAIGLATSANGKGITSDDYAGAEGAVLLDLVKDIPNKAIIALDLAPAQVKKIMLVVPALRYRLLTKAEFRSKFGTWKNAPTGSLDLSMRVVEIGASRAIILAGTPLIGLGGSLDRFTLKKEKGKWIIVKRERNYEMA